ncbi:hypothetical protein Golob_023262, partial [Gossypium lobatum]|nr:hypothetical protein [Gossypium lobatum]
GKNKTTPRNDGQAKRDEESNDISKTVPKDSAVVLVVQEFYALLRDQEPKSTEGHMWEQKKQVCIGKWIHQNVKRCIISKK